MGFDRGAPRRHGHRAVPRAWCVSPHRYQDAHPARSPDRGVSLLLPLLLAAALPGLSAVGRSEEPEDPRAQALRLSSEGAAAYKSEEYAQAIDKFNAAYRLYPAAPLLLDISRAELKLSRCAEAIHHAEMFKAEAGDAPAASPDSPDVWLATVRRACIEAEVDSNPAGAAIWINGERQASPEKTPWTGRLPVGSHKVLLWRAGYQERSAYLDVSADAPAFLMLTLTPTTAPGTSPPTETPLVTAVAPKAATVTTAAATPTKVQLAPTPTPAPAPAPASAETNDTRAINSSFQLRSSSPLTAVTPRDSAPQ